MTPCSRRVGSESVAETGAAGSRRRTGPWSGRAAWSRATSLPDVPLPEALGQVTHPQLRARDRLDRLRHGVGEVVDRLVQGQRPRRGVAGGDATRRPVRTVSPGVGSSSTIEAPPTYRSVSRPLTAYAVRPRKRVPWSSRSLGRYLTWSTPLVVWAGTTSVRVADGGAKPNGVRVHDRDRRVVVEVPRHVPRDVDGHPVGPVALRLPHGVDAEQRERRRRSGRDARVGGRRDVGDVHPPGRRSSTPGRPG